jgi:hypothetical protein
VRVWENGNCYVTVRNCYVTVRHDNDSCNASGLWQVTLHRANHVEGILVRMPPPKPFQSLSKARNKKRFDADAAIVSANATFFRYKCYCVPLMAIGILFIESSPD